MIYAQIKDAQGMDLLNEELRAAKDARWYRRLIIVSQSAQGNSVQELSKRFGVCQAMVRNYIHAYNEGGLEKLRPKESPGRPAKLANWTKEDWDKVLERTPNQYEKLKTESRQWTQKLLVKYVKEYHSIEICRSSVYNSLRKSGRRTGRSKLRVGSPDPGYTVKREQIKDLRDFPQGDN